MSPRTVSPVLKKTRAAQVRPPLAQRLEELAPAQPRHPEVGDHEVEAPAAARSSPYVTVLRDHRPRAPMPSRVALM